MPPTLTPQEFVAKWRKATLKERAACQEHFLDLCRLIGHPTPAEADPAGVWFTFEAGATKVGGGQGWADVWKKGYFAWEYKGQKADLDKAYQQLLQYREALQNPPLLIVSDTGQIRIHTNFTNTVKTVYTLALDDLLQPKGLDLLRSAFTDPEALRKAQTPAQVTQEAAAQFARLAERLRASGEDPQRIAHFLIRLLFCLFAEDVGILPNQIFTRLATAGHVSAKSFPLQLRQLFGAMAAGTFFGVEAIPHVDGRLFDDDFALELDPESLDILARASALDWSAIEPFIFGTLFERSLDPGKRSQLGAHFTGKEDILLIVEPVLMAPLRHRWDEVRAKASALAARRDAAKGKARAKIETELLAMVRGFREELAAVQVLDAACGSGNFLYIALRLLLDLEKEVIREGATWGDSMAFPLVSPTQLHGIEINAYAYELAQVTIWIGYIQWLRENGFGLPGDPILKPLDAIRQMDAIMAYDGEGKPVEPEWPVADVIIGNPPFLGGGKLRSELGDAYTEALFKLYGDRLPNFSDLCCYWFEKARAQIEAGRAKRAGLLATQGIRGGANRRVLERIKQGGDIFWAMSDRDWILDGAAVHVAMAAFDDGSETARSLDGQLVGSINSDLTSNIDLTSAHALQENANVAFIGDTKKGKFEVSSQTAATMIAASGNPNGKSNRDVISSWVNGLDIAQRPRHMHIIDFGVDMSEDEAAMYEKPYEYVKEHVKPDRDKVRNAGERTRWWIHGRSAPDLRTAVRSLSRYIATPRVSKHRLFVFLDAATLPDGQVVIFAREDDYFLGILQSKVHELWARRTGTQLREAESGFRYSQTMTFETYPFPWPPGNEPAGAPRVEAIASAARELVEKRDAWLNPPGAAEGELKKRTLTNLYNQRPTWLALAHSKLDEAVFAAYGWPADLSDDEILARLLALNGARARGG